MKQRFGTIEGVKVYLMDKVTVPEGYQAVQSLATGETAIVKTEQIKNIR